MPMAVRPPSGAKLKLALLADLDRKDSAFAASGRRERLQFDVVALVCLDSIGLVLDGVMKRPVRSPMVREVRVRAQICPS